MTKKQHPNIFLAYSKEDRAWVSEFAKALEKEGISTWFDVLNLDPGERWLEKTQDALRASKTLIVVLSGHSIDSPWTFFELGAAVADRKKIIPILTEDIDMQNLPSALSAYMALQEPSPQAAGKRVAAVLANAG